MEAFQNTAIVWISNSKIYLDTQVFSWRKNGYGSENEKELDKNRGYRDSCRRIDYKNLIRVIRNKHRLASQPEVFLYGSEPPSMSSVLEKMEQVVGKANVKIYRKSMVTGKEKQTMTKLVAEAVERIILRDDTYDNYNGEKHLILVGGDDDMLPLTQIAQEFGWQVKVWAYRDRATYGVATVE